MSGRRVVASAELARTVALIDRSGVAVRVDGLLDAARDVRGRRRELPVRALLVALAMLAGRGTPRLVLVAPLLNSLPQRDRARLGVDRPGGLTTRQVQALYDRICLVLGVDGLDRFCDDLLDATMPEEAAQSASLAVDASDVPTWGRPAGMWRGKRREAGDPDARWRGADADRSWKQPLFGYDLTAAVTVKDLDGPEVPTLARRIRLRPAASGTVATGLEAVASAALAQGRLGDVLVDRDYSKSKHGEDFLLPVRALGGRPVFDLTAYQLGVSGTVRGALVIDGQLFSPGTPKALRDLVPPGVNAAPELVETYRQQVARRAAYALPKHGSPKPSGAQTFTCPARAGTLACPLVPAAEARTRKGVVPLPVLSAPKQALDGTVCSQRFVNVDARDLPLDQQHLFGSWEWASSYARRSRVEGFFGSVKNQATENLNRGTIRVVGLVKVGVLVALAVASANLRHVDSFRAKVATPIRPKVGRPRRPGVRVHLPAGVAVSDAPANGPPR